MKLRLLRTCSDYWYDKHGNDNAFCPYIAEETNARGHHIAMESVGKGKWSVFYDGKERESGLYFDCRDTFLFFMRG